MLTPGIFKKLCASFSGINHVANSVHNDIFKGQYFKTGPFHYRQHKTAAFFTGYLLTNLLLSE